MPKITARVASPDYDMVVLDVLLPSGEEAALPEELRPRLKEIVYLREVGRANEEAILDGACDLDLDDLESLAEREDHLGQLARVFRRTLREVEQLRIEIDATKRNQEVSKITDTDYFRDLREQARALRRSK